MYTWGPQKGQGTFTKEPREESLFWTSIYIWDKMDKTRDSFKVLINVFFGLHLKFVTEMTKLETVSR